MQRQISVCFCPSWQIPSSCSLPNMMPMQMMMMVILVMGLLVAEQPVVWGAASSVAATGELLLTVAYCPTPFTSAGAVVSVDTQTGAWQVKGTFQWPSAVFGCAALEDPTVASDPVSGLLFLDLGDSFGEMLTLDLRTFKVSSATPSDAFWAGSSAMAVDPSSPGSQLLGLAPTVEPSSSPFCSNGCYNYGSLQPSSGLYRTLTDIPFKAVQDDVALILTSNNTNSFYAIASHDLREGTARCAPEEVDNCLITLNGGTLVSSVYVPFDIYAFGSPIINNSSSSSSSSSVSSSTSVMAWLYWEEKCPRPGNAYLFATLDLASAAATPLACVPAPVSLDWDEWIAAFSLDNSLDRESG